MADISQSVGPQRPNKRDDVVTVQTLLNRHILSLAPLPPLKVDGDFGDNTEKAIRAFQERVVGMQKPDSVVDPGGRTLRALNGQAPANAPSAGSPAAVPATAKPAAAGDGIAGLSEQELIDAADALKCETAAVKAVVKTELGIRSAFDDQGRPTILYERHYFHRLTKGRFSAANPDISNPSDGGYGKFSAQYPKLERAMTLDKAAALKSASWGAFQIMGANHVQAGFATVEEFVDAMRKSVKAQADAFVTFVRNDSHLTSAIRKKDWTAFAKRYNGPGYAKNAYDEKMRDHYASFSKG